MTTTELRITIHNLVNATDDPEILGSIYVLLKKLISAEAEDGVIGYEADGTPVMVNDLLESALEADEDVKNGRIVLLKDIMAE